MFSGGAAVKITCENKKFSGDALQNCNKQQTQCDAHDFAKDGPYRFTTCNNQEKEIAAKKGCVQIPKLFGPCPAAKKPVKTSTSLDGTVGANGVKKSVSQPKVVLVLADRENQITPAYIGRLRAGNPGYKIIYLGVNSNELVNVLMNKLGITAVQALDIAREKLAALRFEKGKYMEQAAEGEFSETPDVEAPQSKTTSVPQKAKSHTKEKKPVVTEITASRIPKNLKTGILVLAESEPSDLGRRFAAFKNLGRGDKGDDRTIFVFKGVFDVNFLMSTLGFNAAEALKLPHGSLVTLEFKNGKWQQFELPPPLPEEVEEAPDEEEVEGATDGTTDEEAEGATDEGETKEPEKKKSWTCSIPLIGKLFCDDDKVKEPAEADAADAETPSTGKLMGPPVPPPKRVQPVIIIAPNPREIAVARREAGDLISEAGIRIEPPIVPVPVDAGTLTDAGPPKPADSDRDAGTEKPDGGTPAPDAGPAAPTAADLAEAERQRLEFLKVAADLGVSQRQEAEATAKKAAEEAAAKKIADEAAAKKAAEEAAAKKIADEAAARKLAAEAAAAKAKAAAAAIPPPPVAPVAPAATGSISPPAFRGPPFSPPAAAPAPVAPPAAATPPVASSIRSAKLLTLDNYQAAWKDDFRVVIAMGVGNSQFIGRVKMISDMGIYDDRLGYINAKDPNGAQLLQKLIGCSMPANLAYVDLEFKTGKFNAAGKFEGNIQIHGYYPMLPQKIRDCLTKPLPQPPAASAAKSPAASTPDAGPLSADARPTTVAGSDAGSPDGGFVDAGFRAPAADAGPPVDAGSPDGGFVDAGFRVPAADAGPPVDAGSSDGGFVDAGFRVPAADAGLPTDAGASDGGFVDAGFMAVGVDAGTPPPAKPANLVTPPPKAAKKKAAAKPAKKPVAVSPEPPPAAPAEPMGPPAPPVEVPISPFEAIRRRMSPEERRIKAEEFRAQYMNPEENADTLDAGTATDAGPADASTPDSGTAAAVGSPDGGPADASTPDSGTAAAVGSPDGGFVDAGFRAPADAGLPTAAGSPDGGKAVDAGPAPVPPASEPPARVPVKFGLRPEIKKYSWGDKIDENTLFIFTSDPSDKAFIEQANKSGVSTTVYVDLREPQSTELMKYLGLSQIPPATAYMGVFYRGTASDGKARIETSPRLKLSTSELVAACGTKPDRYGFRFIDENNFRELSATNSDGAVLVVGDPQDNWAAYTQAMLVNEGKLLGKSRNYFWLSPDAKGAKEIIARLGGHAPKKGEFEFYVFKNGKPDSISSPSGFVHVTTKAEYEHFVTGDRAGGVLVLFGSRTGSSQQASGDAIKKLAEKNTLRTLRIPNSRGVINTRPERLVFIDEADLASISPALRKTIQTLPTAYVFYGKKPFQFSLEDVGVSGGTDVRQRVEPTERRRKNAPNLKEAEDPMASVETLELTGRETCRTLRDRTSSKRVFMFGNPVLLREKIREESAVLAAGGGGIPFSFIDTTGTTDFRVLGFFIDVDRTHEGTTELNPLTLHHEGEGSGDSDGVILMCDKEAETQWRCVHTAPERDDKGDLVHGKRKKNTKPKPIVKSVCQ